MTKPGKAIVDLASIDLEAACDKGAEFELVHPVTEAPLGVFISVLGKESEVFQSAIKDRINEGIRKSAIMKPNNRAANIKTIEASEAENVELLVQCTVGWRNMVFEGQELSFSQENVRKIYKARPWVVKQVDAAVGNMELFFPS